MQKVIGNEGIAPRNIWRLIRDAAYHAARIPLRGEILSPSERVEARIAQAELRKIESALVEARLQAGLLLAEATTPVRR